MGSVADGADALNAPVVFGFDEGEVQGQLLAAFALELHSQHDLTLLDAGPSGAQVAVLIELEARQEADELLAVDVLPVGLGGE